MESPRAYPVVSYVLQQTLRRLCTESDWIYAVFWRILPRNYPPPKWDTESSVLDRSKGNKRNWILVWEDGFCDFLACARSANGPNGSASPTPNQDHPIPEVTQYMQPELFFKMSHEVYNYGEGMMGKVAADNSHKWVYKEPVEADPLYPPWQGTLEPHPRTWEAQFKSGIETIAILAVKEGLIQLGSVKKTMEDLNFVLYVRRKFSYLQSIPGVYAMHPVQIQGGTRDQSYNGESSSENHGQNNNNGSVYWGGGDELMQLQYSHSQQQQQYSHSQQQQIPSMSSSLHALLSRLPSVTPPAGHLSPPHHLHGVPQLPCTQPDMMIHRPCPSTPPSTTLIRPLLHHLYPPAANSPTQPPPPPPPAPRPALSALLHPFLHHPPHPFHYAPPPASTNSPPAPAFFYPHTASGQQDLDTSAETYSALVREGIS